MNEKVEKVLQAKKEWERQVHWHFRIGLLCGFSFVGMIFSGNAPIRFYVFMGIELVAVYYSIFWVMPKVEEAREKFVNAAKEILP